MKILGIDYGAAKVGLALGDSESGLALPYKILTHRGVNNLINELIKIIATEKISRVVVGLPLSLQSAATKQTSAVKSFALALEKKIKVPVVLHDERFTSREARQLGAGERDDDMAAMIMLQNYLDKEKSR